MQIVKTDQFGQMLRLVWVFMSGHTAHFVAFFMYWLRFSSWVVICSMQGWQSIDCLERPRWENLGFLSWAIPPELAVLGGFPELGNTSWIGSAGRVFLSWAIPPELAVLGRFSWAGQYVLNWQCWAIHIRHMFLVPWHHGVCWAISRLSWGTAKPRKL